MAILNVTDSPYGAVGDGATDDRAAIQSAIDDAASGDTVYLPANTYIVGDGGTDEGGLEIETSHPAMSIEGDGLDTVLKADNTTQFRMFEINAHGTSATITGLTIRDLTIDTDKTNNDPASDVGYAGIHIDNNATQTTGHTIHIEDVKMQNIAGAGFPMRGGLETVTGTRMTVNSTQDGHCFKLDAVNDPTDEASIVNTFRSLRALNGGDTATEAGNGLNINSTVLIEDVYCENNVQGNKVSEGGNSILRNARFTEHNDNPSMRETTDAGEAFNFTMENVRIQDSDINATRFGDGDDGTGSGTWTVPTGEEIEIVNCNRLGGQNGNLEFEDSPTADMDTVHVDGNNDTDAVFCGSANTCSISTLNWINCTGATNNFGGGLTVGTTNNVDNPGLDVPTKTDVGAFIRSGVVMTTENGVRKTGSDGVAVAY